MEKDFKKLKKLTSISESWCHRKIRPTEIPIWERGLKEGDSKRERYQKKFVHSLPFGGPNLHTGIHPA